MSSKQKHWKANDKEGYSERMKIMSTNSTLNSNIETLLKVKIKLENFHMNKIEQC